MNRQDIVEKVCSVLQSSLNITPDQDMQTWWLNFRHNGGLRLTVQGYEWFCQAQLEHYSFEIPMQVVTVARNLLILDKKMTCPYYLKIGKKSQIVLFGSGESVMYQLYGDFERFVTALDQNS